jgi:hypothetical protein
LRRFFKGGCAKPAAALHTIFTPGAGVTCPCPRMAILPLQALHSI